MLFYGINVALRCKWYHVLFHVSYLVHSLHSVCLVFVSEMGQHTQWVCHSGPKGRPLRGLCYPVCLVACMSELSRTLINVMRESTMDQNYISFYIIIIPNVYMWALTKEQAPKHIVPSDR